MKGFQDDARLTTRDWVLCYPINFVGFLAFSFVICGIARMGIFLFNEETIRAAATSNILQNTHTYTMIFEGYGMLVLLCGQSRGLFKLYAFILVQRAGSLLMKVLAEDPPDFPKHLRPYVLSLNILSLSIYASAVFTFSLIGFEWSCCNAPKEEKIS
ncbi:unnamed protein product [Caenorhabditis sp. 36 PRJEB53466]|nr:unnamed protein product [Caenorhabditis sp. 36 PRJEB53466]